jgi:hypothetical protein
MAEEKKKLETEVSEETPINKAFEIAEKKSKEVEPEEYRTYFEPAEVARKARVVGSAVGGELKQTGGFIKQEVSSTLSGYKPSAILQKRAERKAKEKEMKAIYAGQFYEGAKAGYKYAGTRAIKEKFGYNYVGGKGKKERFERQAFRQPFQPQAQSQPMGFSALVGSNNPSFNPFGFGSSQTKEKKQSHPLVSGGNQNVNFFGGSKSNSNLLGMGNSNVNLIGGGKKRKEIRLI